MPLNKEKEIDIKSVETKVKRFSMCFVGTQTKTPDKKKEKTVTNRFFIYIISNLQCKCRRGILQNFEITIVNCNVQFDLAHKSVV